MILWVLLSIFFCVLCAYEYTHGVSFKTSFWYKATIYWFMASALLKITE